MMEYKPSDRITASEALVGPYLNPSCDAEQPPELPPPMPFSVASHWRRWKLNKDVRGGECKVEDLFTEVVAVELQWPLNITFEPKQKSKMIGAQISSTSDVNVHLGDQILAIASVDVEHSPYEHIKNLFAQWQQSKPIPILLIRETV